MNHRYSKPAAALVFAQHAEKYFFLICVSHTVTIQHSKTLILGRRQIELYCTLLVSIKREKKEANIKVH